MNAQYQIDYVSTYICDSKILMEKCHLFHYLLFNWKTEKVLFILIKKPKPIFNLDNLDYIQINVLIKVKGL